MDAPPLQFQDWVFKRRVTLLGCFVFLEAQVEFNVIFLLGDELFYDLKQAAFFVQVLFSCLLPHPVAMGIGVTWGTSGGNGSFSSTVF